MQACIGMSNHISQFMCLVCMVMCVHPLQVVVLLCTLLYSTVQSTVVQYLYFKPRMSGSKHKSSGDVAHTTVLFKVLYCKIKNVFFNFFVCFFMCYLCEKYYKPITVQYYIVDCVTQVPRIALLDLRTDWTYECALRMELLHMQGPYCTFFLLLIFMLEHVFVVQ